jgi:hypothetical protein
MAAVTGVVSSGARSADRLAIFVLAAASILLPSTARGDGGTLRLRAQVGGVEVSVYSNPPPVRTGMVDISILVNPVPADAQRPSPIFQICAYPVDNPEHKIRAGVVRTPAMNKLFTAAELQLLEPGRWKVEIDAEIVDGVKLGEFEIDVRDQPARFALWIGLPAAVVVVFVAHRWLVSRRLRRSVRPASSEPMPS